MAAEHEIVTQDAGKRPVEFGFGRGGANAPTRRAGQAPALGGNAMLLGMLLMGATFGALLFVGRSRPLDYVVSLVAVAGAILLAVRDNRHLLVYLLAMWVTAPGIRRLVDWNSGSYASLTAISLLPLLTTGAVLIAIIGRRPRMGQRFATGLVLINVPVVLAMIYGLVSYGVASAIDAAQWLGPSLFLVYLGLRPSDESERRYWLICLIGLATLTALYGWVQYLTAPVWDMLWLVQSEMTSSMGSPVARQFRVFSTLNAASTAAVFWAVALTLVFGSQVMRGVWLWIVAALIASALALTLVRLSWIACLVGIGAVYLFTTGRQRLRLSFALVFGAVLAVAAVQWSDSADRVAERAATLGTLSEDGSFQARQTITAGAVQQVIANPLGTGFGESSAAKVAGTSVQLTGVENGYVDLLIKLGIAQGIAYALGCILIVREAMWRGRTSTYRMAATEGNARMYGIIATALTIMTSGIPTVGVSGVLLWFVVGCQLSPLPAVPTRVRP